MTIRHLAVTLTVGVYANSAAAHSGFSNGKTYIVVIPANTYAVTVTAPNAPCNRF